MHKLTEAFRGIIVLERHRDDGADEEPLFLSWTTEMFCEFVVVVSCRIIDIQLNYVLLIR